MSIDFRSASLPESQSTPPAPNLGRAIIVTSAVLLVLIGVIFLVIAAEQWMTEKVAEDSHDRVAPLILERQRAAVNLERFKLYGTVVTLVDDAQQRREALMAAQVLAFHPSLTFEATLNARVSRAYGVLRQVNALNVEAARRRADAPADPTAGREADEIRHRAAGLWREVQADLDAIGDSLSVDVANLTAGRFAIIREKARWVSFMLAGGVAAVFLILIVTVVLARRHVVRPVRMATAALHHLGCGERGIQLPKASTREMDTIFRAVESLDRLFERLQTTQRQLAESQTMAALGRMVAGVAHEINTPLGNAVTAASFLAERTSAISLACDHGQLRRKQLTDYFNETSEAMGLLRSNLDRVAGLITDFKQVAVDHRAEVYCRFSLKAYLTEILGSLSADLRRAGLDIALDCPDDLEVEGYPAIMAQLLTIFVVNAITHAYDDGQSGCLTVVVEAVSPDEVELRFADDGKGIAPDILPHIFEPFFTTARAKGGSGLGLHIAFNLIADGLKGHITANSVPGKGTEFIVRFPRTIPSVRLLPA